jgi:hypothetical protein
MKNNTLGMIKWEQMVFLGNPEYGCELSPIDFVAFAEACGARGFRADDPATCGDVLRAALATAGPTLVEAIVDPFEPPLPPRVMPDDALRLAESLARGQPNRGRIGLTLFRNTIEESAFAASPSGRSHGRSTASASSSELGRRVGSPRRPTSRSNPSGGSPIAWLATNRVTRDPSMQWIRCSRSAGPGRCAIVRDPARCAMPCV